MAASSASSLARALGREQRVAADDQPLARTELGRGDLGQVPLVEDRQLQVAAGSEPADRRSPQRGDPPQPRGPEVLADAGVGQHPPVAGHDDPREREAPGELLDPGGHGAGVGRVALEDPGGHRTALPVAEQGEDDLKLAAPAVAGAAALGRRALRALEVHRGQIAEHERAVLDMPGRQSPLDARLPPQQPVHRLAELLRRRVFGAELLARRVGLRLGGEAPGGGELRAGVEDAGGDHRRRQGAHPRGTAVEQPLEAQLPRRARDGGDMPVGSGAQDLEGVVHRLQGDAALEQDAQPPDDLVGPLREVGEGALADLAVPAEGLAQQDGGRGVPVGHAFDVHGYHGNGYAE